MKKIFGCVAITLLSGLPVAALNESALESAVFAAEALSQSSSNSHSKERFEHYLGLAKIAMREQALNTEQLGQALFKSVSAKMASEKGESRLTRDEERAVYHAVCDLVPKAYRKEMDSKYNYDSRFHFGPEKPLAFTKAYESAAAWVFLAIQEIGTSENGCEVWLWYLNDPVVPSGR